jgi:hypothetical protein
MSFETLCFQLSKMRPRFISLHNEVRATSASLGKIMNRSRILVPLNRLPYEVLERILTEAAEENVGAGEPRKFCSTSSSVCHQWRRICSGIRQLWAFVEFGDGRSFHDTASSFRLASGHPLTFYFNFRMYKELHKHGNIVVALVVPFMPQLDRLVVCGGCEDIYTFLGALQSLPWETAPLSTIRILNDTPRYLETEAVASRVNELFQRVHGLSELTLTRAGRIDWTLPAFGGLTTLAVTETRLPSAKQFEIALRLCPQLEELHLEECIFEHEWIGWGDNLETGQPCLLAELTCLYLVKIPDRLVRFFFQNVFTPALEDVTMDYAGRPYIAQFFDRSDCYDSLESLELVNWEATGAEPSEQREFLENFHNLKKFKMKGGSISADVLPILTPKIDNVLNQTSVMTTLDLEELHLHQVNNCNPLQIRDLVQTKFEARTFYSIEKLKFLYVKQCAPNGPMTKAKREETYVIGARVRLWAESVVWDWSVEGPPLPDWEYVWNMY